ncbi:hypothetical protein BDV23DRAFT_144941 [Aspergillus alliaceus]|uniref:Uncharacterized protein n=1 Tax=Petromyces alliaceus TaxID=209559 RepID=A0A5N7CQ96_PETAA|nr:hypothetical protein BDV23DRAFT_144941 [Aspergillus alliaceus]
MYISPSHPMEPQRPETDYERWLQRQGANFGPGKRPLYGPRMEGLDDSATNKHYLNHGGDSSLSDSHKQATPHGYFIQPQTSGDSLVPEIGRSPHFSSHTILCSVILSVCLTLVAIKSAQLFQTRRRRGRILLSDENTSTTYEKRDMF